MSAKRAVATVAAFLTETVGWEPERAQATAESILRPALSDRQRARLGEEGVPGATTHQGRPATRPPQR